MSDFYGGYKFLFHKTKKCLEELIRLLFLHNFLFDVLEPNLM
jgi:hypothetical protein